MSGICGIIQHRAAEAVSGSLLDSMSDTLAHRGSGNGLRHLEPGAGLAVQGHVSHNPAREQACLSNEDETIWAVMDGNLHNGAELREQLRNRGHAFRTSLDPELIAHLYEESGDGFPGLLKGPFAIALWDGAKRRLILVRDRLGVKPLYSALMPGSVAFASELKAILRHPGVSREIDLTGFSEYMTFQTSMAPRTILAGIRKIPAGGMAVYENGLLAERQYWDLVFPPESAKNPDEASHIERFREAFAAAVRRSAAGINPVGAFLSGGMDSSSVVAMLSESGAGEIHTYSSGYRKGDSLGELENSRVVAEHFKTHHHEVAFTFKDWEEALLRCIQFMDDPVADEASVIRMLLVSQACRDVDVVLGGEGGDDVTGGYGFNAQILRFDRIRRFQRIPGWLRRAVPEVLGPVLSDAWRARLRRGNLDISTILAAEHYVMRWAAEAEDKRRYCPPLSGVDDDHCLNLVREVYRRSGSDDPLSQMQYVYTKTWVAENLTMTANKMAMSRGLDVRLPFLDHELAEVCAGIPSRYKIHRESDGTYTGKYILKKAMRGILPDRVIRMPKTPFTVPFGEWLQGPLASLCRDVLLSDSARSSGLYDTREIGHLLDEYQRSPVPKNAFLIKNLLYFEMWRQNVLSL